jgi:hypothetical protein
VQTIEVEHVPLTALIEHPQNPHVGDVEAITASIREHGWWGVVVAQRSTRFVLVGNHRFRAAAALGMETVPVHWLDVDDARALRIMLADNRTSDLATYDEAALADLLGALNADGGLLGTGYTDADLTLLLQQADGTPQVGSVRTGQSSKERSETYEGTDVRSIVLPYSTEDYHRVVEALARLRSVLGCDSFADVVLALVERADADSAA